jgi:hypothetical protein
MTQAEIGCVIGLESSAPPFSMKRKSRCFQWDFVIQVLERRVAIILQDRSAPLFGMNAC